MSSRHPYWGESVACTQLERRESSPCTKHVTACLRAPKIVRGGIHLVRILKFGSRSDRQPALASTTSCDLGFHEFVSVIVNPLAICV